MSHDDERAAGGQWPPVRTLPGAPRPHAFLTKHAKEGNTKVIWPPPPDASNESDSSLGDNPEHPDQHNPAATKPQNVSGQQTSGFPTGLKLRAEAPMEHSEGQTVFPSQPTFKITQPIRRRGDEKWPPAKCRQSEGGEEEVVRDFVPRPQKGTQDYSEFFAQNALPNTWPGYRAPPGTQHH